MTAYDASIPVSVVIVNWNGREHLPTCIDSLLRQTLPGCEIVVVDNGSRDGSLELLHERYGERVRVVELPENLGFAGGVNRGLQVARGRYLLALNNDTEVDAHCLERLVEAADRHPECGSFAPKILSFTDRSVIDNVGHLLYADGLSRGRGRLEIDHGQYDREEEILLGSGCAVLLRRAMLADAGLFDEDFFAYCDDCDLGLRARLLGWTCLSVPGAVVYHKYSGSAGEYSPLKAFLVERNRAWVAVKCLPWPLLLLSPLFTLLRLGAQAYGALTGTGAAGRFTSTHSATELAGILFRAFLAASRGLPAALARRRAIQSRRRVSAFEPLRWLRRHGMGVREVALKE